MGFKWNLLAQLTPANTLVNTLFFPPAGKKAMIEKVVVSAAEGGGPVQGHLFYDADGNEATENTALLWDASVSPSQPTTFGETDTLMLPMNSVNSTIRCRSEQANGLTFSVYGYEYLVEDFTEGFFDLTEPPGSELKDIFFNLAQIRPAGGAGIPFNITGPAGSNPTPANQQIILTDLIATNTSAQNGNLYLYHDKDGEVFGDGSRIMTRFLPKGFMWHWGAMDIPLTSLDAFAVESDINAGINFTIIAERRPIRSI